MMEAVKTLTADFSKKAAKTIALEQMIANLKFEASLVADREARNAEFAVASAKVLMTGEVASAVRDDLAYGKELFKEMRAIA
jgi:hypothetical protein